jgi:hypothetical protein
MREQVKPVAKSKHGTLVANAITSLTIDSYTPVITITNRSQVGEIWFTVSGNDPAAGGDDTFVVLGARTVASPSISAATTVKLLSTGTQSYSVEGETS